MVDVIDTMAILLIKSIVFKNHYAITNLQNNSIPANYANHFKQKQIPKRFSPFYKTKYRLVNLLII